MKVIIYIYLFEKMPVYLKCVCFYTYKNDDERAAELFSDGGVEVAGFSLPHESLIGDPISTNPCTPLIAASASTL